MQIMGNLWSDCLETDTNNSSSIKQTTAKTAIMEVPNTDADAPLSFDTLLEFYRQERLPFSDDANMSAPIEQSDYRGFCLLIHPTLGLMMLQCSKQKEGKPSPHFQLPGGHVDDWEFDQQKQLTKYPLQHLYGAAKCGSARELFEETGIDMRQSLDRFQPLWLAPHSKNLRNEHKHRLFFVVPVTDSDFMVGTIAYHKEYKSFPFFSVLYLMVSTIQ
jgi:8-oxo-dGTP pyrophosphatase MutT (NUDIX family)